MAVTLVNGTNKQWGVESDETGINISTFSVRYFPEVNEKLQGKIGETVSRAISAVPSREISISGEVAGSTGLMAAAFATAITITNDDSTFGSAAGDIFLDEVTESQDRAGWRSVDFSLSSDPGIAT